MEKLLLSNDVCEHLLTIMSDDFLQLKCLELPWQPLNTPQMLCSFVK